jgi:hypothetical protein
VNQDIQAELGVKIERLEPIARAGYEIAQRDTGYARRPASTTGAPPRSDVCRDPEHPRRIA